MIHPIDTLSIQKFRGLSNISLGGLGGINILVGDNNSGKTSVLEAIAVYSQPLDAAEWQHLARRRVRGFRTVVATEALKWLFPLGKQSLLAPDELFAGEILIEGDGSAGERKIQITAQEVEEPEANDSRQLLMRGVPRRLERRSADELPIDGSFPVGMKLSCNLVRGENTIHQEIYFSATTSRPTWDRSLARNTSINAEIISPFDHGSEELYVSQFRDAVFGNYKSQILQALQLIDPGIQDMEFLPIRSGYLSSLIGALYLQHSRSGRTPLSAFGDGVRRALLIALTLMSAKKGVLLVDEIETAIHVSVLGKFFHWIVDTCHQQEVQLFATTHSIEALDAILSASPNRLDSIVGYHFLSGEVSTQPKRYGGEQLSRLRFERGLDVR